MKAKTTFECEICNRQYDSAQQAIDCESRGIANPELLPIGFMYPYYHGDFIGIFAVAENKINDFDKHFLNILSYASRTPKYPIGADGVNLGEICGLSNVYTVPSKFISYNVIKSEHLATPEFEIMVKSLKANGITPRYANENKEIVTVN